MRGGRREAEPFADGGADGAVAEAEGDGVDDILLSTSSCDGSEMLFQIRCRLFRFDCFGRRILAVPVDSNVWFGV